MLLNFEEDSCLRSSGLVHFKVVHIIHKHPVYFAALRMLAILWQNIEDYSYSGRDLYSKDVFCVRVCSCVCVGLRMMTMLKPMAEECKS